MDLENDGKMIAGVQMSAALDRFDTFEQWNWPRYFDACMMITNQDEKRQMMALGELARETHSRPFDVKNLEIRLRSDISDSFQTAEKTGGVSAIASMVWDRETSGMSWRVLEDGPHILASNFGEGQFGWISGILGTGKSDTGLSVAKHWIDMENEAVSNIKTLEPVGGLSYVHDARDFFLRVADMIEAETRWNFIFDEAPMSGYQKAKATTNKAVTIDQFCLAVRKLGGNMVVISQREHAVPTTVVELATSKYTCHKVIKEGDKSGILTIDLQGPYRYYHQRISDFPPSGIPFKSKDISYFATTEVVDIDGLLRVLGGEDDVPKAIRKFIKQGA